MALINLYRIDEDKKFALMQALSGRMELHGTELSREEDPTVGFSLYVGIPAAERRLSWGWALEEFGEAVPEVPGAPSGLILAEVEGGATYAVTLGHAYFLADRFCDRDFGFRFARKLSFREIRTTTLTTPNSRRNKTVSTYIHYPELEFDSGESFAKLKARVDLEEGFTLYKPSIEIGSSLRFSVETPSLRTIRALICHVEAVLATREDICRIPVFSRVRDPEQIELLNRDLAASFARDPGSLNLSELDIVGVTEVFRHSEDGFELRCHGMRRRVDALTEDALRQFCDDHGWDYRQTALDITAVRLRSGSPIQSRTVRELIDYTDDSRKCLLARGFWYRYNEDYLGYLRDSIAEIDAEYHPEFDFTETAYAAFLERKLRAEQARSPGTPEAVLRSALSRRYYAERAYNLIRAEDDGFRNFDRQQQTVGGCSIEVMDLWRDGKMCAVKLGSASSKLCYAVDQSLTALRLWKKGALSGVPPIDTVVLWFVLERSGHIEDETGRPRLERLEMLMLQNRLDQWKKEVRLLGLRPLIYVNYRTF